MGHGWDLNAIRALGKRWPREGSDNMRIFLLLAQSATHCVPLLDTILTKPPGIRVSALRIQATTEHTR